MTRDSQEDGENGRERYKRRLHRERERETKTTNKKYEEDVF